MLGNQLLHPSPDRIWHPCVRTCSDFHGFALHVRDHDSSTTLHYEKHHASRLSWHSRFGIGTKQEQGWDLRSEDRQASSSERQRDPLREVHYARRF